MSQDGYQQKVGYKILKAIFLLLLRFFTRSPAALFTVQSKLNVSAKLCAGWAWYGWDWLKPAQVLGQNS